MNDKLLSAIQDALAQARLELAGSQADERRIYALTVTALEQAWLWANQANGCLSHRIPDVVAADPWANEPSDA